MTKNTKKKGQATVFIYREGKKFIGVCLELCIVEENKNLNVLRHNMREAVEGYVEAVIKNGLSEDLLNRPAPKEYWNRFLNYLKQESERIKFKKSIQKPNYSEVVTLPLPLPLPCSFCYA
jgi:hypothetical protein